MSKFSETNREIVDAHTHLGLETFIVKPIPEEKKKKPAFQDRMENRIEALIERMDANGVDRAVAFPFPLEEVDPLKANTYILNAYQAYPNRIIPFLLVENDLEHWLHKGAKGFKQHFLMSPERFDLEKAYRTIAEAGVPLITHLPTRRGISIPGQVREIRKIAPTLKLIIAHMGRRVPNTGEGVEENLIELKDMENVYLETSTVRDPEIIAKSVEVLGEHRIVFGSDFPFNSYMDDDPMFVELETIRRANLKPDTLEKVFGQNLLTCLSHK
jgi:predicted TIM-barrel fold metal-dependent hydrolase